MKIKKRTNNVLNRNLDKNTEEPFIVTYRSRPIQGIQLELVTLNSEYSKEKENIEKNRIITKKTKYGENGTTTEER